MLKIRSEQMVSLQSAEEKRFLDRLVDFLQSEYDEAKKVSPDDLRPIVEQQIKNAQKYGLVTEQQAAIYVITAWLMGEKFDVEFDAPREVLPSHLYTPDDKAEWLSQWTEAVFLALEEC